MAAAEAEYWFGQAWIANGEVKRSRWMVAEARETLSRSPLKSHRSWQHARPTDGVNFHADVRFGVRATSLPSRDSSLLTRAEGNPPFLLGTAAPPPALSEDTMNALIKRSIAAVAAVVTTLTLFSAVASIADDDKVALMAAKSVPGKLAASTAAATQR